MKLSELTQEQRAKIEDDNLGKVKIYYIKFKEIEKDIGIKISYSGKIKILDTCIKQTIKRIDDEVEFLNETGKDLDDFDVELTQISIAWRVYRLEKQKELYYLMRSLE